MHTQALHSIRLTTAIFSTHSARMISSLHSLQYYDLAMEADYTVCCVSTGSAMKPRPLSRRSLWQWCKCYRIDNEKLCKMCKIAP